MAYPNQSSVSPAAPSPVYVAVPPTSGVAFAALILVFFFLPLGIVLGHVARGRF